jgi:hypothetical protein
MTDEALERVRRFEDLLREAYVRRFRDFPEPQKTQLLEHGLLRHWSSEHFITAYRAGDIYPETRLIGALYRLFDIRLQLYFLLQVDGALYRPLVLDAGFDRSNPLKTPELFLAKLSIDQSLILKSRVLWERLMNFVYYLELGEDLENKVSGRKSKRKVFFDFVESHQYWVFLSPYAAELDYYEQNYRGPEAHKASRLRAALLKGQDVDMQELFALLHNAMTAIWQNILNIVQGRPPSVFTKLHHDSSGKLDPKYLRWLDGT